jgi:hypothetical protein
MELFDCRNDDFLEGMTPTLAGTVLLHGSIQPGSLLEEQLTAPPCHGLSVVLQARHRQKEVLHSRTAAPLG